ncbi:unnamed protein product [Urochloa humidicola]
MWCGLHLWPLLPASRPPPRSLMLQPMPLATAGARCRRRGSLLGAAEEQREIHLGGRRRAGSPPPPQASQATGEARYRAAQGSSASARCAAGGRRGNEEREVAAAESTPPPPGRTSHRCLHCANRGRRRLSATAAARIGEGLGHEPCASSGRARSGGGVPAKSTTLRSSITSPADRFFSTSPRHHFFSASHRHAAG